MSIEQKVQCMDCGATWTEVYEETSSYSSVHDPKPCDCASQYKIIDAPRNRPIKSKLLDKLIKAGVLQCMDCGDGKKEVLNACMLQDPLHEHHCKACLFLGSYNNTDLYLCHEFGEQVTLLARYSSDPPDYASGWPTLGSPAKPFPSATHRELRVAWLIAHDCGLI